MKLELKKEYHESDGKSWYVLYAEKSDGTFRKEYFTDDSAGRGLAQAKARFEELKLMPAIPEPELILSYNSEILAMGYDNNEGLQNTYFKT